MTMTQQTAAAVEKAATAATYGGSGGAVFFGLTANEFAAVGGLLIAVIGFVVNVWFKLQHLKIAKSKAQADPEA